MMPQQKHEKSVVKASRRYYKRLFVQSLWVGQTKASAKKSTTSASVTNVMKWKECGNYTGQSGRHANFSRWHCSRVLHGVLVPLGVTQALSLHPKGTGNCFFKIDTKITLFYSSAKLRRSPYATRLRFRQRFRQHQRELFLSPSSSSSEQSFFNRSVLCIL